MVTWCISAVACADTFRPSAFPMNWLASLHDDPAEPCVSVRSVGTLQQAGIG
jgi:hypothetical protein